MANIKDGEILIGSIMKASVELLKLRSDAVETLSCVELQRLTEKIADFMGYLYHDIYVLEILRKYPDLKGLLEELEKKLETSTAPQANVGPQV